MASNSNGSSNGGNGNSNGSGNQQTKPKGSAKRGFAAMDEATQRAIASKGGQAAHQKGTAHEFDSEEARRAGQKGGEVVSRDREHMAAIGRKGGESRQSAARASVDKDTPGSEQSAAGGNQQGGKSSER